MDTRVAVISIIVENPEAIENVESSASRGRAIYYRKNGNSVPGERD